MNTKDKKISGDEEYQYPNEEYVTETTPPEEQPVHDKQPNFFIRLMQNNKRVTVVIVLIFVALIGFKLFGSRKPTMSIKPAAQPLVPQPTMVQPSPEFVNQLSSLKQDEQSNQSSLGQLQGQIQDLRNQLGQTTTQQAQVSQAMMAMVQQIKQLEQDVQAVTAKHGAAPKKVRPTPPPMVFHLRAIVPGRAWIISNDGLSESVSEGDTVPQYGTVQVVDANRGMVLTSSGKVIGYGPNDR